MRALKTRILLHFPRQNPAKSCKIRNPRATKHGKVLRPNSAKTAKPSATSAPNFGDDGGGWLRGRRRPFDPRVLGAIVGRKLFGELRVEIPRHLVQCFTNGRP